MSLFAIGGKASLSQEQPLCAMKLLQIIQRIPPVPMKVLLMEHLRCRRSVSSVQKPNELRVFIFHVTVIKYLF